jgi:hypothetical protein
MEKENKNHCVYKEFIELRGKNVTEVDWNDCQYKEKKSDSLFTHAASSRNSWAYLLSL